MVGGLGAFCGVTEWVWWERAGEGEVEVEVRSREGEEGGREGREAERQRGREVERPSIQGSGINDGKLPYGKSRPSR